MLGRTLETPITRLLRLPVVPTIMGFDPRLQLLHEDDSVEALAATVRNPVRGAVNVAGPGAMALSRAMRQLGFRRPEAVKKPDCQPFGIRASSFSRNQIIMSMRGLARATAYAVLRYVACFANETPKSRSGGFVW